MANFWQPTSSPWGGASEQYEAPMNLRGEWTGFDLLKVGGDALRQYRRGNLVLVSGCITTVSPMKHKACFDMTVGSVEHQCIPCNRGVPFIAPTAMSRYEGIRQCGTCSTLRDDGKLVINFNKNTNPMVLHYAGFAYNVCRDEAIPLQIATHEVPAHKRADEEDGKGKGKGKDRDDDKDKQLLRKIMVKALVPNEEDPPGLQVEGAIVSLQGSLMESTFGFAACHLGTLPEGYRPKREVRCLGFLLTDPAEDSGGCPLADQSVAVTLRPDGNISAQGGKVQNVDQKGNMRILQQKKKGRLSFDGIRFSMIEGEPLDTVPALRQNSGGSTSSTAAPKAAAGVSALRAKLGLGPKSSASVIRQDDVVMLEGYLDWASVRSINTKQAVAQLPKGCWPRRRETFFTRGGSDVEERRRVDIDHYGRIFCPEGAPDGHVELSGIIFVAAAQELRTQPADWDYDELRLQYNRTVVDLVSSSFDGHDLLEKFIRRCNVYEWKLLDYKLCQAAGRKMLMPLGDEVVLRGWERGNEWNVEARDHRLFKDQLKPVLRQEFGISSYHTLLHLSDDAFDRVLSATKISPEDRKHLVHRRRDANALWARQRQPGLIRSVLEEIAEEIVEQMIQHWDFKAQVQGLLKNDFRAPKTIDHLFPRHQNSFQQRLIKENIKSDDLKKFEEIRQFFYLYETTGSNMTHCSLMGAADLFTTTGKWHFPDAVDVQQQLFENIAWLFDRNIHHYISERQTPRFPFIEDFDIQAAVNWREPDKGCQRPPPPDDLIMMKPTRDRYGHVCGDPGMMMRHRAQAINLIYPNIESLECLVYSASGYNKGKELLKSSFHLVWPQLLVDPDRAPVIRYVTLGIFKAETRKQGSDLNLLQKKLLELDSSNEWELVFDSTTINARNGLRLPYNDKASMVVKNPEDKEKIKRGELSKNSAPKMRVVENRPSKAVGKIVFEFEKDEAGGLAKVSKAEWVADEKSLSKAEWIGLGTCRRDQNSAKEIELTPWHLGPDVMAYLPKKPGEKYYRESEDDNVGEGFNTHVPYPNIRRVINQSTTNAFVKQFEEELSAEEVALETEDFLDLRQRIAGSWINVTEDVALWRTMAAQQFQFKVPDAHWQTSMKRSAEVLYLRKRGKVILDGPADVQEVLLRVLKNITTSDDYAIMPIYDVTQMQD